MAIEIVDFPIENGGSFHSYVTNYQRVSPFHGLLLSQDVAMTGIWVPAQETQFVIDQGGQPTTTGAIFTFRGELSLRANKVSLLGLHFSFR